MYLPGDFPNFFLPVGRPFGVEVPVTRYGKSSGSMLVTGQLKPMTSALREDLADILADAFVEELERDPPS
jgi:hypothetical protein